MLDYQEETVYEDGHLEDSDFYFEEPTDVIFMVDLKVPLEFVISPSIKASVIASLGKGLNKISENSSGTPYSLDLGVGINMKL